MSDPSPDVPAAPPSARPERAPIVAPVLSALVPGLGQLVSGRVGDGVLFLCAMLYVRLFLTGFAEPAERMLTFVLGAPAIEGGLRKPILVVFTLFLVGLHGASAVFAAKEKGRARPSGLAL